MSDDLVKRLRANTSWGDDRFAEAADRIEQLTSERDHAWEMVAKADTQVGQSLADRLQDKAQIDRLREALAMIDAIDPEHHIDGCAQAVVRGLVLRMGETARAALKGETT